MSTLHHWTRIAALAAILGLVVPALVACEDQGPAEEAGEAIDETAEGAGEAVEDATD